jgi:RNA methyltransferase, TrmH family
VEGALGVPGCVVEVFATAAAAARYADLLGGAQVTLVADDALDSLGGTVAPQGLVAVCRPVDRPVPDVLAGTTLAVVCADVRDPGNAGTVIRSADAAGAGAVVLAGQSVDAYNGKTVRATVGSLFHVPLAVATEPEAVLAACREAGLLVVAADGAGETDLDDAVDAGLLVRPTAWLFGNEAWGLPDDLAALADHRVRIPIHGRAESLNLSTAAAVCLYASARAQRPS